MFAVNTLAPYILTCLINPPAKRLVFVSSGLHRTGDASCKDITWAQRGERAFTDSQGYADSKMQNILLAGAFAQRWPTVQSNSLDPGWVPTKMGGSSATGDINAAVETYVLLAEGTGAAKGVSGKYWFTSQVRPAKEGAEDPVAQQKLLKQLEELTGVTPGSASSV